MTEIVNLICTMDCVMIVQAHKLVTKSLTMISLLSFQFIIIVNVVEFCSLFFVFKYIGLGLFCLFLVLSRFNQLDSDDITFQSRRFGNFGKKQMQINETNKTRCKGDSGNQRKSHEIFPVKIW